MLTHSNSVGVSLGRVDRVLRGADGQPMTLTNTSNPDRLHSVHTSHERNSTVATKKKAGSVTIAPEEKAPRLKKDGTAWAPLPPRRPDAELLKEYQDRRAAALVRHAKEIAKLDAKITHYTNKGVVDPVEAEAAAKELLGEGMTPEQIEALIQRLGKAKKALAGKTPEEVAAMKAEALAAKQTPEPAPSEVPSFLQPVG